MAEYIDRRATIDAVQRHREGVLGGYEYDEGIAFGYAAAHRHIAEVLEIIPSADVQPVRHGYWIESDTDGFVCSVCRSGYRNQPTLMGKPMFEYCPVCGARMDGEQNG